LPPTQRSGAHSASVVQERAQLPSDSPEQVCAPPQSSSAVQPQTPLVQMPLAHCEPLVQPESWQLPPQK